MMLAWIGTICGILGSVLVAANSGLQFVGYCFFLIGAVSCVTVSIKRKDKAGFTLWAFFTVINLWGIVNYA